MYAKEKDLTAEDISGGMIYNQIRPLDVTNAPGLSVSIFLSGCPLRCEGCHNQELWNLKNGKKFTSETEQLILRLLGREYIRSLVCLGGEPLLDRNLSDLAELTGSIPADKDVWLYTGYTLEELKERCLAEGCSHSDLFMILNNINYIVDGRFEQDKRDITLAFRGSSNQRIWHRVKQDFFDFPQFEDVTASFDAGKY